MTEAVIRELSEIEDANRCRLSRQLADNLDKEPGGHIAICGDLKAYFVVDAVHDDVASALQVAPAGLERIRTKAGTTIMVSGTVPDVSYEEAWTSAGLHESLLEAEDSEVLVSCPHGGDAEKNTDVMGRHLCQMLRQNGVGASAWLCQSFDSGYDDKDSFSRWHLEKPVRAIDAYPKLERIKDQRFEYVVGFHLQSSERNSVLIGGQADADLRSAIAESLQEALGGDVDVKWRYDEFALTGRGDDNSINYFAKNGQGVQIEMPPKVCRNKFKTVPRQVRDVLLDRI